MTTTPTNQPAITELQEAHQEDATVTFGFWMYLMSDFVLFAALFATYVIFRSNVAGGPTGAELFSMPYVLVETIVLLTSSFTCGLTLLAARMGNVRRVRLGLLATGVLGGIFVGMEFAEFKNLIASGAGPQTSGFLSSYFTLVGTHGLHVFIGLLWIVALLFAVHMRGLTRSTMRKLALFSIFWHFLDIIWIFIFTIVYLMRLL